MLSKKLRYFTTCSHELHLTVTNELLVLNEAKTQADKNRNLIFFLSVMLCEKIIIKFWFYINKPNEILNQSKNTERKLITE